MDTIDVEGLQKRYGEVQALASVSFAVRKGEVFGLLGPNGAGKSTAVRILAVGLPLLFFSAMLIDFDLIPGWMQWVARVNPVQWAVDAAREPVLPSPDWSLVALSLVLLTAFPPRRPRSRHGRSAASSARSEDVSAVCRPPVREDGSGPRTKGANVTERDTETLSDDEILTTGAGGEPRLSADDDSTDADTGDDADDMDADTDDTDA